MLSFFFEIIEAIIGLVARAWRSPLKAEVHYIRLVTVSGQNPKEFPHYCCRMKVTNNGRDAVYTTMISLTVQDNQVFRIRDGSDRIRIDTRQPHLFNLSFPVADIKKALDSAPYCIEIKPTSGRSLKVHGFLPKGED